MQSPDLLSVVQETFAIELELDFLSLVRFSKQLIRLRISMNIIAALENSVTEGNSQTPRQPVAALVANSCFKQISIDESAIGSPDKGG